MSEKSKDGESERESYPDEESLVKRNIVTAWLLDVKEIESCEWRWFTQAHVYQEDCHLRGLNKYNLWTTLCHLTGPS